MMRIEPRPEMTKAMLIAVPMLSAIASLVIAAVPIAFAGAGILQAYREMFNGVFGSVSTAVKRALAEQLLGELSKRHRFVPY